MERERLTDKQWDRKQGKKAETEMEAVLVKNKKQTTTFKYKARTEVEHTEEVVLPTHYTLFCPEVNIYKKPWIAPKRASEHDSMT